MSLKSRQELDNDHQKFTLRETAADVTPRRQWTFNLIEMMTPPSTVKRINECTEEKKIQTSY